ncbi:MAG: ROK family protein [Pseudomonadota bacterium]
MADARPHCALAFDLGGTKVRAGLFEGETLLRRASANTDVTNGPAGILDQFEALFMDVSQGISNDGIAGIGLASAGPIDTVEGTVPGIPTIPGLENFAIRETLSARLGQPVLVENDAIAAAYGEWQFGAGQGLDNLVYLTVSSGIGGGAVVDGRLLHGRKGMAGHVGHLRLTLDGPRCLCGANGCFEALASGNALGGRARQAVETDLTGYLGATAKSSMVSAKDVFDGARLGDAQCLSLVDDEARYLGHGIVSLIHIFSPERVILGGGVSSAFDLLEPIIHSIIRTNAVGPFRDVKVVQAALGDNSGLVGAAALVLAKESA